jgi:predicted dehydrogenase
MQRVSIGIIGSGASVEWAIVPALSGSDALSPPDTGAWWSRRPAPAGDIRYQPPASPEIVALCAGFGEEKTERIGSKVSPRLELLGRSARGAALYEDAGTMLRELPLDALLIAAGDDDYLQPAEIAQFVASAPGLKSGVKPPRWLWIDGPPARTLGELGHFARTAMAHGPALWIAAPLKRAAAHRAARRLLERDGIGEVTALQARFPFPLDSSRFGAAYAAFDLLLSFIPGRAGTPREVTAARHEDGAASVLLRLTGGATLTVLFGASDAWNAPLPRLEICGTQGRFIVCESGRRLWHHVPREGARLWEPPGLATHVSASNLSGYGEDLKAFLAVCVNNPAPFNAERALDGAARALGALEATFLALETGVTQSIEARGPQTLAREVATVESTIPPRNLTLELG